MKLMLILLLILAVFGPVTARENLADFRAMAEKYYYYLEGAGPENFSCLFTSGNFLNYAAANFDSNSSTGAP